MAGRGRAAVRDVADLARPAMDHLQRGSVPARSWKDASAGEHEAFLQWAEAYWQRRTPTSFSGHLGLFDDFAGPKLRLRSREEIDALLATPVGPVPGPF